MKIALGADHGGFAVKQKIKAVLTGDLSHSVIDMGIYKEEPCDYPDHALLVAQAVATDEATFGIMIDGAGIGSTMACNKVPGIRAALCYDLFTATNAREHNNANVLCLGGQTVGPGHLIQIVKTFLTVPYAGGRHDRRVQKIMGIEKRYLREI